jgi:pyruvate/2-oxoglutarate dehydrogenase complex dihydrolipoamide acyltransferase (E2) component
VAGEDVNGQREYRRRGIEVRPFPARRKAVLQAMRVGRRMAPMHGLLDVDATRAVEQVSQAHNESSFTGFVVAAVARAAAGHPEVHAYRDYRGRLVTHRHVDVTTLIEVPTADGAFPLGHVVRDADVRSVSDITRELRGVKADPLSSPSGYLLQRVGGAAARVPWLFGAFYRAAARSRRIRGSIGTVAVTSVGMFADGGGFGIGVPTVMSLTVVVGGRSRRPRGVGDAVELRDVLDLTITIDHNVVDGAPAARFAADLRRRLESADLFD